MLEINYEEDRVFLDLDGVILDTQQRVVNLQDPEHYDWSEQFFKNIDWQILFEEAKPINNSIEILKEIQQYYKKIQILSKFNVIEEANIKVAYMREKGIEIPINLTPVGTKKSTQIGILTPTCILVDDMTKNVEDWNNKGGKGIHFSENIKIETPTKVKSLEFLLR